MAALCRTDPGLVAEGMSVIWLRRRREREVRARHSLVLRLGAVADCGMKEMAGVVGWEKNEKGQMGPRLANLR